MAAAFTLLDTIDVTSSVATIDFPIDTYSGLYEELLIHILGLQPANNNTGLALRISTDGGSSFESGSTNYKFGRRGIGSTGSDDGNSNGNNAIDIAGANIGNTTSGGLSGQIIVARGWDDVAKLTQFQFDAVYYSGGGHSFRTLGSGYRDAASIATDLRLFAWTGNIEKAKIKIIGLN